MKIKGKNALITGGAKRIGKKIALSLAENGCNVIIHYNSSEEEAIKVKKEAEKQNGGDTKGIHKHSLGY